VSDYIPYQSIPGMLPIQKGDTVYVASNIVKLAFLANKKEDGFSIDSWIDALQEMVGEEGTLLFPAFTFRLKKNDHFDPATTTPITGTVPAHLMSRKDFKRTSHPLHSFLVWGKGTQELIDMNNVTSFGQDSPFGFIHRNEGKLLSIDLDLQHSLAQAHYTEELAEVFYRQWKEYKIKVTKDGVMTQGNYRLFHKKMGYYNDVNAMLELFTPMGISKEVTYNGVLFRVTDLMSAHALMIVDIRDNAARRMIKFSNKVMWKQRIKLLLGKPII